MNRRTVMTILGGASLMTAIPALGHTQAADMDRTSDADRAGVQAWVDNFAASWAVGDGERMFRTAAEDVEWVNIVGMHWRGKTQVIAVHNVYLNIMFKGVPMSLKSIDSLRSFDPGLVIAVVRWSVGQFSPPDGSIVPASDDRMTLVFRRTPEGLQLVHGANVRIDPVAANFDPSKGPPPAR